MKIARLLLVMLLVLGGTNFVHGQDVNIQVNQLGVGGRVRPGDMAGLLVSVSSDRDEAFNAWVQWEVRNVDGDIGEYGRFLTINPASAGASRFWLYAPLSPFTDASAFWTIGVYEADDGERGARVGQQVYAVQQPANIVPPDIGMIGVMGQFRAQLGDLSLRPLDSLPIATHEQTLTVSGIQSNELPDRWWGLSSYEAIYWGDTSNAPPSQMNIDSTLALVDWISRGGHLIVSLPAGGNPWGIGTSGQIPRELERLLPCYERTQANESVRQPRAIEDVPVRELMETIAKSGYESRIPAVLNRAITMRVFQDPSDGFDVLDNHYQPLIRLPDGKTLVIQRTFGAGHITVIGLDLTQPELRENGLPQSDVFWNRILSRRADTPTSGEWAAITKADIDNTDIGGMSTQRLGRGELFADAINQSQQAGLGLLLALILFLLYWLVAGPGAFMVLKSYGLSRHSWLAFGLAAIVFTGLAWVAVTVLPNRKLNVRHLTVLDHVAQPTWDTRDARTEPQMMHATSYMSVYNPSYNDIPLRIEAATPRQLDLLVPYFPAQRNAQEFPNADRFLVNIAPDLNDDITLTLPSRATSTLVEADWRGTVTADWGSMIREDPNDPIRVVEEITPTGRSQVLRGTLSHDLPGSLRNVTIYWVRSNRVPHAGYLRDGNTFKPWKAVRQTGQLLNVGSAASLPQQFTPWDADTPFPLRLAANDSGRLEQTLDRLTNDVRGGRMQQFQGSISDTERRELLSAMTLFQHLEPPRYLKATPEDNSTDRDAWIYRVDGRELDLSAWLNRPCLIVVGYLYDVPLPLPLRIGNDDEAPPSSGMTMVRWILPLELDEPKSFPTLISEDAPAPTATLTEG
ncbi:MAG: hypothetical protein AAF432_06510 [Planctomycetota bacterium]